jgi:hypothetical protein
LASDIEVGIYGLDMFKNRVLGRMLGLKRDEVTGGWRKLLNDELRNMYSSSDVIGMIKPRSKSKDRACSTNGVQVECI